MSKKPATKKADPPPNKIQVHFNLPVDKPSLYATNIIVQPAEHEMILAFFEVSPPLLLGDSPEENLRVLRSTGLRADCVARITVSKNRFEEFANVMKNMANELKKAEKSGT